MKIAVTTIWRANSKGFKSFQQNKKLFVIKRAESHENFTDTTIKI
jgi:hypothetical protein